MNEVHEFNPTIYPFLLWVMIGDVDAVLRAFSYREGADIDKRDFENCQAVTIHVRRRADGKFGELVWARKTKDFTPEVMAHESFHVAVNILHDVGIRLDWENDEPFAYLIGWGVKSINSIKKKRP